MRQTRPTAATEDSGDHLRLRFHHLAVQTTDLNNSVSWYRDYLGAEQVWSLDDFSELTRSRLPGIRAMAEVAVGDIRIHLFERPGGAADPATSRSQFQHLCIRVRSVEELAAMRQRWTDLRSTGRYSFALDEQPTDIVTDSDGVQSFYTYDVNGLEFEFTYMPSGMS
ncbi:dioxygenase [Micromonospora echinospora]|uniref:Catechol 2,3-dioxygenase n=1 Tax=Micromonospora echinospora TaxID=1877 RepID=A0A1C4YRZ1_MICEC|nr:VOC family protein [Micromonospora echinospora]OZV77357.1 dioxygenase [Micromonospora echinospora]SCF23424.1 Catechol 2,3-dioxygenase [Micromonospora echinospora]